MIFNFLNIDPQQIAFDLGENQTMTYGEFTIQLQHFIQFLRANNLNQGDRVMFWLAQDITLVLAYYACIYLGVVAIPLFAENTIDEFQQIKQLTNCNTILTCPEISEHIQHNTEFLEQFRLIDCEHFPTTQTDLAPLTDPAWPDDTKTQLFLTSGSTGTPKAVVYNHKTLHWADKIYREALQLTADDFCVTTIDLNGNAGLVLQILPFLNVGARIRILRQYNCEGAYQAIKDGATFFCMIPWLGMDLLDYTKDESIKNNKIRYCLCGGDRIPDRIFTDFPKVLNIYPNQVMGMSETNIYAMNLKHAKAKPHAAGTIVSDTEVKIMTNEGLTNTPDTIGEVMVKTPMRFEGYWQNPELTEQTIVDDWVKTGDLGYFDEEGCLYFAGRIKQIIIHRGDNIYPQEIETACMQHPNIKSAIAVGIENPLVGEDIALAVTLHDSNKTFDLPLLHDFLSSKLSDFKFPTKLHVFEEFPKNKNGKVDRKQLKQYFN